MWATFRLRASRCMTPASFAMRGRNTIRSDTTEGCCFTSLFMLPAASLSIPFPYFSVQPLAFSLSLRSRISAFCFQHFSLSPPPISDTFTPG